MGVIIKNVLAVTMNKKNEILKCNIIAEGKMIKKITTSGLNASTNYRIIDGSGMICIPALINGHVHSDVTLAKGLGDGLSLYQQDYDSHVSRKNWFRDELRGEAGALSRLLLYCEAIKGGTGFICDIPFWPYRTKLLEPIIKLRLRGAIAIDYRTDFLNGKVLEEAELIEKIEWIKSNGAIPVLSGPSEEHYEISLLKKLQKIAEKKDCFIHLHLAETKYRVGIIKQKYRATSVQFLDSIGFLSERLIGSHCVHLTENDIELLIKRGVRIVNCPTAEMKISDGIAPIVNFIDSGYYVGLGTDGALWNDSSDMIHEMKTLLLVQRVKYGAGRILPIDALSAGTIWGARTFGIEKEMGSIEEGKSASIAILNPNKPHVVPIYHGKTSNILQNIITCMNASDVETLLVDGNILMENKKITLIDEKEIIKKSQEIGSRRFSNLEL